jgi:hypothetical protein
MARSSRLDIGGRFGGIGVCLRMAADYFDMPMDFWKSAATFSVAAHPSKAPLLLKNRSSVLAPYHQSFATLTKTWYNHDQFHAF